MLKNNNASIIAIALFSVALAGCSQQEITLKRLAESQRRMQQYVDRQEAFFARLKEDAENNRLTKGLSRPEILSVYGEPIFCDPAGNAGQIQQRCLYRRPTRYFSTDLIYLDFDKDSRLISWEMRPAK